MESGAGGVVGGAGCAVVVSSEWWLVGREWRAVRGDLDAVSI